MLMFVVNVWNLWKQSHKLNHKEVEAIISMATMSTRVINNKVIISHANIEVHIMVIRDHKVQKHTREDIKTITKMKIIEVTGAGVMVNEVIEDIEAEIGVI
jgi:hypothetical protein